VHKLTSSDLAEVEQLLRAQRQDIVLALRQRRAATGRDQECGDGCVPAAGTGAACMCDEVDANARRHELDALREIDSALQRIEFNVGGVCAMCGAAISIERLRGVPTATTCAACAAPPGSAG
jgi:RNA polymerase-binding transcription factor DksA